MRIEREIQWSQEVGSDGYRLKPAERDLTQELESRPLIGWRVISDHCPTASRCGSFSVLPLLWSFWKLTAGVVLWLSLQSKAAGAFERNAQGCRR